MNPYDFCASPAQVEAQARSDVADLDRILAYEPPGHARDRMLAQRMGYAAHLPARQETSTFRYPVPFVCITPAGTVTNQVAVGYDPATREFVTADGARVSDEDVRIADLAGLHAAHDEMVRP